MKHIGVSFLRIGWKLMFQSSVRPFASMRSHIFSRLVQQDCPLDCLICLNQDSDAIPSLDHHQPHRMPCRPEHEHIWYAFPVITHAPLHSVLAAQSSNVWRMVWPAPSKESWSAVS